MSLRPLLVSITSICLLLTAGCKTVSGGSCHKPQPYEDAENLPPLRVPAGLDGPQTDDALEIPEVDEPEAPLDPKGPCLDAPPAVTAPPLPPSEVAAPDTRPPQKGKASQNGSEPQSGEQKPDSDKPRPQRRPR